MSWWAWLLIGIGVGTLAVLIPVWRALYKMWENW